MSDKPNFFDHFFDDFLDRFLVAFGFLWGASGGSFWPLWPSKRGQVGSRTRLGSSSCRKVSFLNFLQGSRAKSSIWASQAFKMAPQTAQDRPKRPPRGSRKAIFPESPAGEGSRLVVQGVWGRTSDGSLCPGGSSGASPAGAPARAPGSGDVPPALAWLCREPHCQTHRIQRK